MSNIGNKTKIKMGVSITVGGYVEVDSEEQRVEYEKKIMGNDFADIRHLIEPTHFEADCWDES